MPSLSTIVLSIKGEARKVNLTLNEDSSLSIETLQKYFKKKDEPESICCYDYDNKHIYIFGYKKGKKGTENKTEIPEPYSDVVLFGDALVIVSQSKNWENPIPYIVDQWNVFTIGVKKDDEMNEDESDEDEEEAEAEEFEEDEVEKSSIIEEEIEEEEEEEKPVRRKRAAAYNKVDTAGLKEDISIESEPETNKIRLLCISNLKFIEDKFSNEDIRLLEKGIFEAAFNFAIKNHVARSWKSAIFIEIYREIVRSVFSNIHPDSPVKNHRLLIRVIEGEFPLYTLPSMTSYEMFPEKWFELRDKQLQREQKILEGNKSRATDQFKCRRCLKRECTYYELQTRSADEPMTIFITCLNCGKEWRQGG